MNKNAKFHLDFILFTLIMLLLPPLTLVSIVSFTLLDITVFNVFTWGSGSRFILCTYLVLAGLRCLYTYTPVKIKRGL